MEYMDHDARCPKKKNIKTLTHSLTHMKCALANSINEIWRLKLLDNKSKAVLQNCRQIAAIHWVVMPKQLFFIASACKVLLHFKAASE